MTVTSNGCDFVPVDSSSGASRELPKSIPPYIATTVGDSSETV